MYPVPPCPSASTSSPTAPNSSCTWREGKRLQPSPSLSKAPRPSALSSKVHVFGSMPAAIRRSLPTGMWRPCSCLADSVFPASSAKALPPTRPRTGRRHRTPHPPGLEARHRQSLVPRDRRQSLGALLGLGGVSGNELLDMLDWLSNRQPDRTKNTTLILYDVTSTYLEGQQCPLAAFGHNRDGKKGKKQMVLGLLCAADGVRSRSKSSPATPPTRPRWPPRSARSGAASGSAGWPWWATAA